MSRRTKGQGPLLVGAPRTASVAESAASVERTKRAQSERRISTAAICVAKECASCAFEHAPPCASRARHGRRRRERVKAIIILPSWTTELSASEARRRCSRGKVDSGRAVAIVAAEPRGGAPRGAGAVGAIAARAITENRRAIQPEAAKLHKGE